MIKRLITSIIGIPLFVVFVSIISPMWNEIPFLFLLIVVGMIVNTEIMNLVGNKKDIHYPFFLIGILTTISVLFSYFFSIKLLEFSVLVVAHSILFFVFFYYSFGMELVKSHNYSKNMENIGFYLLLYITLVLIYPQFIIVKFIHQNFWSILLLFAFSWCSDAFGLFIGMKFGKHPLTMLPSKSKTIEGYVGSIVLTSCLGMLFYNLQGFLALPFQWSLIKWMFFGFALSLSSNFGDLMESLIKRWCDSKDSGTILPGLGGIFDTIDSPLYSIPVVLLFFYS